MRDFDFCLPMLLIQITVFIYQMCPFSQYIKKD